ncbi:hypothetical protein PAHAL_4G061800 [Panicum hallii]|uniref:Uncharacterized protein n=1 Tax=Panicum hallii TaxID=206008 RepID=A0A2T8JBY0_9POAL|nr:hypothetical protein PAHAL_4G061800 [Panicum hallii]
MKRQKETGRDEVPAAAAGINLDGVRSNPSDELRSGVLSAPRPRPAAGLSLGGDLALMIKRYRRAQGEAAHNQGGVGLQGSKGLPRAGCRTGFLQFRARLLLNVSIQIY